MCLLLIVIDILSYIIISIIAFLPQLLVNQQEHFVSTDDISLPEHIQTILDGEIETSIGEDEHFVSAEEFDVDSVSAEAVLNSSNG